MAEVVKDQSVKSRKYDKEAFTDSMLLQKASGGLALRGILKTNNIDDQLEDKEFLLEVPENIKITVISKFEDKTKHFSSRHQEEHYKKRVDTLGFSFAYFLDSPSLSVPLSESVTSTFDGESSVAKAYFSTVKHSTKQVASFTFEYKDMKLSRDVRGELKEILNMLGTHGPDNKKIVQDSCKRFLRMYGSHAYKGPLTFGGHFWMTCSSSGHGFSHEEIKAIKELQSKAISIAASLGGSVDTSIEKLKESFQGKCSTDTLASTDLCTIITGAPPEVGDFVKWKNELVSSKSTWVLTDRGTATVPIWTIIMENHENELGSVASILRSTWEEMTRLESEQKVLPKKLSYPVEELSKETPAPDGSFCKVKEVQEITDLESLSKDLEKTVQGVTRIQSMSDIDSTLPDEVIDHVSESIQSFQRHNRNTYYEVFVSIIAVQLFKQANGMAFMIKDLLEFFNFFNKEKLAFIKYLGKHPLQYQAYLFDLALKVCQDTEFQPLVQQVREMMKALDPPLEQHLKEVLSANSSVKTLKLELSQLMSSKTSPNQNTVMFDSRSVGVIKKILEEEVFLYDECQLPRETPLFQNNPDAHSLLEKLGLLHCYPKGLQLEDAHCLRLEPLELSLGKSHPTDPKQLPHLILQKIMAYDYQCRSDLMQSKQRYYSEEQDTSDNSSDDSDVSHESCSNIMFSSFEDKDSKSLNSTQNDFETFAPVNFEENICESEEFYDCYDTAVHPLDSLLAIILCSNDFLRQDLLSRLAKCQLSIPFILPDPFTKKLNIPLWAMRSIVKDWKLIKKNGSGSVRHKKCPIVTYKMPIVSFIRFGKNPPQCISKILNEILSESSHKHFFHDDCPGGQYTSVLRDGLVDMCWYVPAGKPTDEYPFPVTFLNLHGDARQHPKQNKFLSQISSMCFILLTEVVDFDEDTLEILKRFSISLGGITLLNGVGEIPSALKSKCHDVNVKRNLAEVKNAIQTQINIKHHGHAKDFHSIEECCHIKSKDVLVDEDYDPILKNGLSFESEVRSKITDDKDSMLPLQKLWRDWAAQDKEAYRQTKRGNKSVEAYSAEIKSTKENLRQQQVEHVMSLSPLMESFMSCLLKLDGSSNKVLRNYFLHCLKLNLNNKSGKVVAEKQHKYHLTRLKLQKAENAKDEALKSKHRQELQVHQQEITNASFGIEHLIRELGQVYEAAKWSSSFGKELSRIPKAAAQLLIDGYPLELMDGDVAHVPLVWVKAVIAELVKILEDPNVYVLSVLGLQSTGKSTMLNAMFGLQFNVSAGRCTRGAFMHLLPIDKDIRKQTKYSYVLVVDTEGLRAPELNHLIAQKHDNELATFVIGLANTTLINIYGAVPGDMDDILQTSVHAFIRMNQVKHEPSCHFIHQNAEASRNNEVGQGNFTQKLNAFTVLAAAAENLQEKFSTFNDVIKFDDQKNVHFFEGLFKGDPLKAPINHGYSVSAQMMKLDFVWQLWKNCDDNPHLSSFSLKLQDLWKALLKEKFVFSFKNTREVTAYNTLETKYSNLKWTFRERMFKWEKTTENEIKAQNFNAAPTYLQGKLKELNTLSKLLYDEKKGELNSFFYDEWSAINIQWKGGFEKRLAVLSSELKVSAEEHCKKLVRSKRAISEIEKQRETYTSKLTVELQRIVGGLIEKREKLEQGQFKSEHLKQLIKASFFTTESLQKYKEQGLISEEKVTRIKEIMAGELTDDGLETIILIMGKEQAKQIIKKEQTEEELEFKFNQIWDSLMKGLDFVTEAPVDIKFEVEKALIEFVREQGYESQLLGELEDNGLNLVQWGIYLKPEERKKYEVGKHEKIIKSFEKSRSKVDKQQLNEDYNFTELIFANSQKHLDEILAEECDFKSAFTYKLLRKVAEDFADKSLPAEYKLHIFLIICGHAVPKFEEMSKCFREQFDPRHYLEKYVKNPLCTNFKNQFYQIEAEEAIACNLCAHLEEPMKEQVEETIVRKVFGEMRCSAQHFSSKKALKVKILTDLHERNKFSDYMDYVMDVKKSLLYWLETYTKVYCDGCETGSTETKLQKLIKNELSRLIGVVETQVNGLKENDASKCLAALCDNAELKRELAVNLKVADLQTGYEEVVLASLQTKISDQLVKLKERLHCHYKDIRCQEKMEDWKKEFHKLFKEHLIGCTAQCPFCKAQCDRLDPAHIDENEPQKHTALVHRPACLGNYRRSYDQVLVIDICPSSISGSKTFRGPDTDDINIPFKKYQTMYPNWDITPDITSEDSVYWMLFVGKFRDEIARHFGAKPPEVPKEWKSIKWERINETLKRVYLPEPQ